MQSMVVRAGVVAQWCGILVLAIVSAGRGTAARGAAFDIWYRPGPEARWTLYGGRATRAEADREAAELTRMAGYETKISGAGEPRPDVVGVEPPLARSTAIRGTTYVARPGLGYGAQWARHWGGWNGWGGAGCCATSTPATGSGGADGGCGSCCSAMAIGWRWRQPIARPPGCTSSNRDRRGCMH